MTSRWALIAFCVGVSSHASTDDIAQFEPAPPATPLAKAELSPLLRRVAERDHVLLGLSDVQSVPSAPGDAMVIWVGTVRGEDTQQWLIQLKRGIATSQEQKTHRGADVKKFLSWGSVVVFRSEVDAIDLWIAGPVKTGASVTANDAESALPPIRRVRIFAPRDYLRLGLDDSVRANRYIDQRIREILKEDPKFGYGHIYSLDKPIKTENVGYAKPVAARIGISPAMEQAWAGGYVALQSFYDLANEVPELRGIADIALERPSVWKLAKLAWGTNFKIFFGGQGSELIDPAKVGLLPVALETYQSPFAFTFGDEPIVNGVMAVTAPATPLDVGAGILGLVAVHPKDKTRMVQLVAISASRANSTAPEPR